MNSRWSKPVLFLLCTLPFCVLVYNGFTNNLTANPIKEITHFTGEWALRFLLITLSITPLRKITRKNALIRFRRMLGLFAFFYACLHFSTYLVLDQFFDWNEIVLDVAKRPYITVGFSCFCPAHPAGGDVHQQNGATAWEQLAPAPFPDLSHCGPGHLPLPVAGQGGYPAAGHLRPHPVPAACPALAGAENR